MMRCIVSSHLQSGGLEDFWVLRPPHYVPRMSTCFRIRGIFPLKVKHLCSLRLVWPEEMWYDLV